MTKYSSSLAKRFVQSFKSNSASKPSRTDSMASDETLEYQSPPSTPTPPKDYESALASLQSSYGFGSTTPTHLNKSWACVDLAINYSCSIPVLSLHHLHHLHPPHFCPARVVFDRLMVWGRRSGELWFAFGVGSTATTPPIWHDVVPNKLLHLPNRRLPRHTCFHEGCYLGYNMCFRLKVYW